MYNMYLLTYLLTYLFIKTIGTNKHKLTHNVIVPSSPLWNTGLRVSFTGCGH